MSPSGARRELPAASVVICAYTEERWGLLQAAVESVRSGSIAPLEILVVVDGNATLLERVRAEWADVVALASERPRGLAGARNTGVPAARGAVVAFLDDDAVAAPDWLERLTRWYAVDARIAGVGGPAEPTWTAGRPRWFPSEFDWVVGCTHTGSPEAPQPVRNLVGANMSFRADVLARVGGFDERLGRLDTLPVGCEETELCIRVRRVLPDVAILYDPAIRVRHTVPPQRATWRYFVSRCAGEGRSKALLSRLVGTSDGLETERTYVTRTLPRAVGRGLADAALHGDLGGAARAGATLVGFATTAGSYSLTRARAAAGAAP